MEAKGRGRTVAVTASAATVKTAGTDEFEKVVLRRLRDKALGDPEYWDFRKKRTLSHSPVFFQYPAMMVPQMQGRLIDAARRGANHVTRVLDPFAGSGIVLSEAMIRGLNFSGQDINPLSILICQVRGGPFHFRELSNKSDILARRVAGDRRMSIDVEFDGRRKWFERRVAHALSRIRRAILQEEDRWARRFFWLCLAETVRLTSNSRTSTYKLHIRSKQDLKTRKVDALETFQVVLARNLERYSSAQAALTRRSRLKGGHYVGRVSLRQADSARRVGPFTGRENAGLLVTSPPYGDNQTTVPYGQHSFLPLQWIPFEDIGFGVSKALVGTTQRIDSMSLGGSRRDVAYLKDSLVQRSPALGKILGCLPSSPKDGPTRVLAFAKDLDRCLRPILQNLNEGAFMVWTLGNRRVGKQPIPVDAILQDFLESRGARRVFAITRQIPTKRMANRNSISSTITNETILVLRKE